MLIEQGFPIVQPEAFSTDARPGVEAAWTKPRLPGAADAGTGPFAGRKVDLLDRLNKCLSNVCLISGLPILGSHTNGHLR